MKDLIKKLLRENIKDEGIQLYVDIINGMDMINPKRNIYIQALKDKYGYEYTESTDKSFINTANLNDIKTKDDFDSWDNYKKYAREIFKLRNIPLQQSMEGTLTIDLVAKLVNPFGIKVNEISSNNKNHAQARSSTIDIPRVTSIEVVIHELGHVFDYINKNEKMISKDMCYTITHYGLNVGGEAFAENFAYYFLYPKFLNKYIPEVYKELDSIISIEWKSLINKLHYEATR